MASITLASFNTHYGLVAERDRVASYDVGAVLGAIDADVVVVQEVWRPDGRHGVIDAFAAERGYAMHHVATGAARQRSRWPHHHPDGEGTLGTAVLSRLPARLVGPLPVGPTPGDPSPLRVVADVELNGDRPPLRIVGVHLTSRLPYGPPQQLRRLARQLPPVGAPTVVAGDCNFWGPPAISLLGRGWQRAVVGATWPARHPHSQIDHVLVRRGEVRATDAAVLDACGSDHRPVRVRLTW
jgi:endonuclease/exonuclease/phosphatase family metal-dependent hydrolase